MGKAVNYLVALLSFGLFFVSCQKEESEYIDPTGQKGNIDSASALASLMKGVSQHPGSGDNIIDGSSCTELAYPYKVIANGQQVSLKSEADIALVLAIFDIDPNDEDEVELIFPVTVVLTDFSEITITDEDMFEDLIDDCQEGEEITCVDFVYPISVYSYNAQKEQTGILKVESDEELYLLLLGLENKDLISIDFPVTVIVNEIEHLANNNEELEYLLDLADCDDDTDTDDDDDLL